MVVKRRPSQRKNTRTKKASKVFFCVLSFFDFSHIVWRLAGGLLCAFAMMESQKKLKDWERENAGRYCEKAEGAGRGQGKSFAHLNNLLKRILLRWIFFSWVLKVCLFRSENFYFFPWESISRHKYSIYFSFGTPDTKVLFHMGMKDLHRHRNGFF